MDDFYRRAMEKLGFRQRAYAQAFGIVGSPAYLALVDLAEYCGAWRADSEINREMLHVMTGRRQAFFRIWQHLNLNQQEMETVMKGALLRAAENMKAQGVQ